jgi:hypothetical protein
LDRIIFAGAAKVEHGTLSIDPMNNVRIPRLPEMFEQQKLDYPRGRRILIGFVLFNLDFEGGIKTVRFDR